MDKNIVYKNDYPPQYLFDGKVILLLQKAIKLFNESFKDKIDLIKYEIHINVYENEGYICLSFLPKIETDFEEINFEIPKDGLYKNGPAISYFFSIEDLSLIKIVHMR